MLIWVNITENIMSGRTWPVLFGDKVNCFEINFRHCMSISEVLMCIMRSVNFPGIASAVIFLSSADFPGTLREVVSFGGGGR